MCGTNIKNIQELIRESDKSVLWRHTSNQIESRFDFGPRVCFDFFFGNNFFFRKFSKKKCISSKKNQKFSTCQIKFMRQFDHWKASRMQIYLLPLVMEPISKMLISWFRNSITLQFGHLLVTKSTQVYFFVAKKYFDFSFNVFF